MLLRGRIPLRVGTLLVLCTALASGASDADRASARALAQEGQEALDRQQYAIAADRFARADALVHAPTLLLALARAQVGLGQLVEAHENLVRIQREDIPTGSPRSWSKAREDAQKEVEALAPRLPWITFRVRGTSRARVILDGETIPEASLGARRPANPGSHKVRAEAQGYTPIEKSFTVAEGEKAAIELDLLPLDATPSTDAQPAAPPRVEAESGRWAWRKGTTYAAASVGALGLAAGAVAGVMFLSQHEALRVACKDGVCSSDRASDLERMHDVGTFSVAAFATGAVGAGAALVLLLTAPTNSPPLTAQHAAAARLSYDLHVGPSALMLKGTF